MKIHDRPCSQCGALLEQSRTRAEICAACMQAGRRLARDAEQRTLLEKHYLKVENAGVSPHGKSQWKVTHTCGGEQTMLFANIKKGLDAGRVPCLRCK